jgi:hypothetical protein
MLVFLLRRSARGELEAIPAAPVRVRTLEVAVPHPVAQGALARSVVFAAENAAKSFQTHLLQSRDSFRVALVGSKVEVCAGQLHLDPAVELAFAEDFAELPLRSSVSL